MNGAVGLGPYLERLYERYSRLEYLSSDPLQFLHRYGDKVDREVVGFLSAGLAFGRVSSVLGALERALAPLGDAPAARLREMSPKDCEDAADGFVHRWVFAPDLANIFKALGGVLRTWGDLEAPFMAGIEPRHEDLRHGSHALVTALWRELPESARKRRGTTYLLPQALGASASKRLHLFLRWMVRTEDVDLGLWRDVRPSQLLIPVDTHVARIATYLGLTRRKVAGCSMVLEITDHLRALDPSDPVKYDFALSRLGILGSCQRRRDVSLCRTCELLPVCQL